MAATGQRVPFVPEFGQGRDYLNRSSSVAVGFYLYLRRHHAFTPRPQRTSRDPYFYRSRAFPKRGGPSMQCGVHVRPERRCSPEAEAWTPSSRALSFSRDLAYVTAGRHLGLWLGHKFPLPLRTLFLEARLSGRGFGPCVPRPGPPVLVSAWRGARVGPALLLCPAPRWTAAGTGEAALGGARGVPLACARGCWDGGGVRRPPAAVRQGGRRRRGRGRP